ncbi:IS3-like element ISAba21 family transposase (plasmid) [Acinetobacter defluvii]|uniref:IS3-like element ISAba21 family transposase n=3 Tax=Acinetobacter TaxID=469 RepID=A0A2S2F8V8_9GAMM|nr:MULTISPECIES: IS3-like element ISAba21 family transposase [Acinetobacter]AWL27393.1 IS3-like element ISAba21 family transposase [Acinetobacter defluvii]NAR81325.1 IS3-like element ISAba21 family transposase [Acinetobacter haemolyticus]RBA28709.1 IS3-like element ISAba21 family transposase [Acinetobacter junii]RBA37023.1 IS3-like element ISAba21 family transposase [Acinetobacter junii]RBA41731.1 IS3-like element ISAba21 family transposase [Acinetobacter junii]
MSKKQKTYTAEFKVEAIKLIEANQGNVSETARQLGISMQTLSNWNNKAKTGTLAGTKQYSPDLNALLEENKKLKQQLKTAEMEREFPKKGSSVLCERKSVRYAYMKQQRYLFPISFMARLLHVSVSRFYDWLKRGMNKRLVQRNQQTILVKIAHEETKQSYGYIRLTKHLQAQGIKISTYAVRQIKKLNQLYCKRHKRFKRTTKSDHNRAIYANLLEQQFSMTKPNLAWSSDITYIWTAEGWLYLAAVKDLYTKQVVGYSLNERMTAQLVCNALTMAIRNQKPTKGLIVHSDRGSQYCSHEYRKILEKCDFQGSMSKRGDCYDNAPIESFWGILKNELVHHCNYKTRDEAKADITKYIVLFYNQRRIQKSLDFKTPNQIAENFYRLAA